MFRSALIYQKAFRFYARDTNGKYPVDVDGLRVAFVSTSALGDQLRSFRAERMARLLSGAPQAPLQPGAKIVLHVVPLQRGGRRSSVSTFDSGSRLPFFPHLEGHGRPQRHRDV